MNCDKKELTKIKIHSSFEKIILKKEFDKIKVNEIVLEAGINRSTFYCYFDDKYDLLQENIKLKLLNYYNNNVSEKINGEKIIIKFLNNIYDSKNNIKVLCNHAGESRVQESFTEFAEKLYTRRLFFDEFKNLENINITAKFLASGSVGCIKWWLFNKNDISPNDLGKYMWKFYTDILENG